MAAHEFLQHVSFDVVFMQQNAKQIFAAWVVI